MSQHTALRAQLSDPELLKSLAWLDGQWVDAPSRFPVNNPADGTHLVDVPNQGAKEAEQAIVAAAKAFPGWAAKTGKERAQLMRKWFDLIVANACVEHQLATAALDADFVVAGARVDVPGVLHSFWQIDLDVIVT